MFTRKILMHHRFLENKVYKQKKMNNESLKRTWFLRPLIMLLDISFCDRRPRHVQRLQKVGQLERRLQQLIGTDIRPWLLHGIGVSRRAWRPFRQSFGIRVGISDLLEVGGGDDFADRLHESIADDNRDIGSWVSVCSVGEDTVVFRC